MCKTNGKIDVGSMMNAYPQEIGHLKLTTVLTLISRLNEKGFISTEKQGRVNYYVPIIPEGDYKRNATAEFIENVHKNSPVSLISALFDMGAINKDDIDEFRKQILKRDESGE